MLQRFDLILGTNSWYPSQLCFQNRLQIAKACDPPQTCWAQEWGVWPSSDNAGHSKASRLAVLVWLGQIMTSWYVMMILIITPPPPHHHHHHHCHHHHSKTWCKLPEFASSTPWALERPKKNRMARRRRWVSMPKSGNAPVRLDRRGSPQRHNICWSSTQHLGTPVIVDVNLTFT